MDILLALTSVIIVLITSVNFYSKWKYSYWKSRGVVQLEPEFFYGNTRDMLKGDKSIGETFLEFYKKFRSLGVKYGGTYIFFRKIFIPVDPELIKDIMVKSYDHFSAHVSRLRNATIVNSSLFHLRDEPWRNARKKLTPTFTSGKMKMMFETLMEKTAGLIELAGETAVSGEPANIKCILGRFTTDVIASCGFGIESNALKNPDSDFVKYGRMLLDPPKNKSNLWQLFLRILFPKRTRNLNDVSPVEDFFKKIVLETVDFREKNKLYRKDFMHLMIQLKNRGVVTDDEQIFNNLTEKLEAANTFDLDEITAHSLLFYIAGYETSATTMTFALLELAQHQDLQEKVRQEGNGVLKNHDGKMTYEAMLELSYTEKVIYETLRKYPPLPNIPRVCTKDYTIPGTNIVIEKDTPTFIPAWGVQMDPEYYPDPEKFDPERFSEENKKNIKEFTFMPFGEGPRMCLGLRFGMMQSKVGLVSLLQNYNFTLHPNTTFPLKMQRDGLILAVDGDVWLNISKVK